MGIIPTETDKKIKLTFPDSLITQPLIYEVSQLYDVVTNIEKASVGEKEGWVILGMRGNESDVNEALEWMVDQGVCIQTMFPEM